MLHRRHKQVILHLKQQTLRLAYLALVLVFLITSMPHSAEAAINCDPASLPEASTDVDPYTPCQDASRKALFEQFYNSCLKTNENIKNMTYMFSRLAQLRLVLDKELFYISRIPYTSTIFNSAWSELRERWKERLANDKQIFALDADPRMGKDRCRLNWAIGLDCGDQPGVDMFEVKRQQAIMAAKNTAAQYKNADPSLIRDLIKAQLVIDAANHQEPMKPGEDKKEWKKSEDEKKAALKDYVYNYYPELQYFFDDDLKHFLNNIIDQNGLRQLLYKTMDGRSLKGQLNSTDLIGLSNQIIATHVHSAVWSDYQEMMATAGFNVTYNKIIDNFDHQIRHSRSSRDWTLDQDYLIATPMREAAANGDLRHSRFYQTFICENLYRQDRDDQRKEVAMAMVGGLALLTGVGAMFDVGAMVVLGLSTTSIVLVNASSAYEVYSALQDQSKARNLFLLQGMSYRDMSAANKDLLMTVPWVIINAAMVAPAILLERIAIASKAATLARNLDRVRKLARYRKAIGLVSVSVGAGFAAYNVHAAYKAVKQSMDDAKQDSQRQ